MWSTRPTQLTDLPIVAIFEFILRSGVPDAAWRDTRGKRLAGRETNVQRERINDDPAVARVGLATAPRGPRDRRGTNMNQAGEPFDPYYHWLGIPPEEQPPHHYRLLGIRPLEENRDVIQNAADRQMSHLRTFQNGPHGAMSQQLLNEVAAARLCLLSQKKAAYDQQLRSADASFALTPPAADPPTPAEDVLDDRKQAAAEANQAEPYVRPPIVRTGGAVRKSATRRRSSRRQHRLLRVLAAAVYGLLIAVVVVGIAAIVMYATHQPASGSRLVLNWPSSQRAGAVLEIDGRVVDLSRATATAADAIELPLQPGPHQYRVSHPTSRLLEGRIVLSRNEPVELDIVLSSIADSKSPRTVELVLIWPVTDRKGSDLEIDGRLCDLNEGHVKVIGNHVRVALAPGKHAIALVRGDGTRISRVVDVRVGQPVRVSSLERVGTIQLHWRTVNQLDFTVLLDGHEIDFQDPTVRRTVTGADVDVPIGDTILTVRRDDAEIAVSELTVVPGKRLAIDIDQLISQSVTRIVLQWPVAERNGALLEVDGQPYALPTGPVAELDEIAIDVQPGERTVRVTRPGCDVFERNVIVNSGFLTIEVDIHRIVAAATSAERVRQLRDDFEGVYTEFSEFAAWIAATDPREKQEALANLLNKMLYKAGKMEDASAEQYVAYDQIYQMAVDNNQLATAGSALERLRVLRCISEDERQKRFNALWSLAVNNADLDVSLAFFQSGGALGRTFSVAEQQTLIERMCDSLLTHDDLPEREQFVEAFEQERLVTPAAASGFRARLLLTAVHSAQHDSQSLIDLAENILAVVPGLLGLETDNGELADELIATVNRSRRKVLIDRDSAVSLRPRVDELKSLTKTIKDEVDQYRRATTAHEAITAGEASGDDHKLLGFWLLHRANYDEALSHLQQTGDASLAAVAVPSPQSARQLSDLADAVDLESRKTKYNRRREEALGAYASHLRRLALEQQDGTLEEEARARVKARVEDAERRLE